MMSVDCNRMFERMRSGLDCRMIDGIVIVIVDDGILIDSVGGGEMMMSMIQSRFISE